MELPPMESFPVEACSGSALRMPQRKLREAAAKLSGMLGALGQLPIERCGQAPQRELLDRSVSAAILQKNSFVPRQIERTRGEIPAFHRPGRFARATCHREEGERSTDRAA